MPKPHTLTWTTPADYANLADIVFDAVRKGPSQYTEASFDPSTSSGFRTGLGSDTQEREEWVARLDRQAIAIGRDETRVIGFMTLEPGGYIDFAYIRPKAQRTGLFRRYSRRSKRRPSLRTNRGFGSMPA